jgi:hypothetical protein
MRGATVHRCVTQRAAARRQAHRRGTRRRDATAEGSCGAARGRTGSFLRHDPKQQRRHEREERVRDDDVVGERRSDEPCRGVEYDIQTYDSRCLELSGDRLKLRARQNFSSSNRSTRAPAGASVAIRRLRVDFPMPGDAPKTAMSCVIPQHCGSGADPYRQCAMSAALWRTLICARIGSGQRRSHRASCAPHAGKEIAGEGRFACRHD